MPKTKKSLNRRPQAQKSRSLDTLAMLVDPRGGKRGQVPSGKAYARRPKHGGWEA